MTSPSKSGEQEPVHEVWRPTIEAIVTAFAEGDFALTRGIAGVAASTARDGDERRRAVASYGVTLASLSQETWKSSVSMWMGEWWDVIVDLWSVESGRTDLVVELRISEHGEGYRYVMGIIYVP